MAQSIRNTISSINASLDTVFNNAVFYGVAQTIETQTGSKPVVSEKNVGFDDSYGMIAYHKLGNIGIKNTPGFGRSQHTINNFSVSLVVFNNEKKTARKPDEIAMIMQSVLSLQNITDVRVLPVSVILNTQAIWQTEYRGQPYKLPEYASLFQLNYTVEVTFKSGCFDLCPEDFSQCKNT